MQAKVNMSAVMNGRSIRARARANRVAVLALVVGLGFMASNAFGQYYTDPNYPGWIYDPYYGWIYVGETEPQPESEPEPEPLTPDPNLHTSGNGTHRMVAVGIDNYLQATSLPSCINDVDGFISALVADSSRWNSSNITRLTDSSATTDGIRLAIYNMAQQARPGDVCVFFQSSHGGQIQGTSMALSTYDSNYLDTQFGSDLGNWFADGVKIVVVIDACYSAGLFKDGAGKEIAARSLNAFVQNVSNSFAAVRVAKSGATLTKASGQDIGFLTASDFNETSAAGNPFSLFAGKLIDAFSASDSDSNDDGQLSFLELFNWAAPRSGSEQSPQASNEALLSGTIAARKVAGGGGGRVCSGMCGIGCAVPMIAGIAMMGAMRLSNKRRTHRRRFGD